MYFNLLFINSWIEQRKFRGTNASILFICIRFLIALSWLYSMAQKNVAKCCLCNGAISLLFRCAREGNRWIFWVWEFKNVSHLLFSSFLSCCLHPRWFWGDEKTLFGAHYSTVCGWYRLCICCVPILLKTLDAFHSVSHLTQYLFSSGGSSSNEGPKKSAIHQK